MTPVLTLLGRRYCHLCDDMLAELRRLQASHAFSIEFIDVDAHAHLERRFGERVPVLLAGERELCHHHFEERSVVEYLSRS